jgi:hypothetical protein
MGGTAGAASGLYFQVFSCFTMMNNAAPPTLGYLPLFPFTNGDGFIHYPFSNQGLPAKLKKGLLYEVQQA